MVPPCPVRLSNLVPSPRIHLPLLDATIRAVLAG
jgi:hypothetical protein